MLNQDGEPTTPHKLEICAKSSVSNLRVLFYPCVVQKATAYVEKKVLNMCHWSKKSSWVIFVGITQHHKGYLFYVHSTQKKVYLLDAIFDETFCSELSYTSCPYPESLVTQRAVLYIPYDTSSHEKTRNIITFIQFEEGNLVEIQRNVVEEKNKNPQFMSHVYILTLIMDHKYKRS